MVLIEESRKEITIIIKNSYSVALNVTQASVYSIKKRIKSSSQTSLQKRTADIGCVMCVRVQIARFIRYIHARKTINKQ